ncbi:cyclic nucleotide-gated cation channel beta-1-like isoform X2 [Thalassophryne amazonica]|uniref:cyclic nucleotide-gated cation channel beta-1-like isoform X2 n=1 Tax=Thalassophryne amazonica TaxID=390379 RepID=UPI001471EC38|nr:cyclic nucleotide-gated cation channel beta-1-like isoform X2 [Thalassophryne amazonica]
MLSWVVKVVPQPAELQSKNPEEQTEKPATVPPAASAPVSPEKKVTFQDELKCEAAKPDKIKQDQPAAEESSTGVLTWISSALPQPASTPKLSRTSSTTKENTSCSKPDEEKGIVSWITQGLEKVVPQPDLKNKELAPSEQVCQTTAPKAPDPHITVVDMQPPPEDKMDNKPFPPRMIDWIKQGIEKVVPHPEIHVHTKTEEKTEALPPSKVEAPPPEPPPAPKAEPEKSSKDVAEHQPSMIGWIVSGIGRMLPQPAQKLDSSDDVHKICIVQSSDLVLEDLDPHWDTKTKQDEKMDKEEPQSHSKANVQVKQEIEDVTQMEQWTPLMDSIKKEAEQSVLAHMEERLQQERLEAARVAEEMARKAAEEAVRQLEVEHSAKIVIDTLKEPNEQLPNILEEQNEDDPELQNLREDSEDSTDNKGPEDIKVTEDNKHTEEEKKDHQ